MEKFIKILWSDDTLEKNSIDSTTAIILVDTLRCSSTLAAALNNKAKIVYMAREISKALELKDKYPEAVLAGERGSVKVDSFEATNSPVYFSEKNTSEKVILSSGNFCNVLEKYVHLTSNIFSATLVNATSTANYLVENGFTKIYFIAIGTYHMHGEYFSIPKHTTEDFWGAALIARVLEKRMGIECNEIKDYKSVIDNPARLIQEIQKSDYVKYLQELDIQNHNDKNKMDMVLCWQIDRFPTICILDKNPDLSFIAK